MNTGLLVERKVVKDEMQRLVEGLVEEEKRRGSAEEGRARVEREVDDLSATLFEQVSPTSVESKSGAMRRARGARAEREESPSEARRNFPERSGKKARAKREETLPSGASIKSPEQSESQMPPEHSEHSLDREGRPIAPQAILPRPSQDSRAIANVAANPLSASEDRQRTRDQHRGQSLRVDVPRRLAPFRDQRHSSQCSILPLSRFHHAAHLLSLSTSVILTLGSLRQTPWSPPNAWPALKRKPDSGKPRRTCRRRKRRCGTCSTTCRAFLRCFPPRTSGEGSRGGTTRRTSRMSSLSRSCSIFAYINRETKTTSRSFRLRLFLHS